jgi:FkbM family methyltransferase
MQKSSCILASNGKVIAFMLSLLKNLLKKIISCSILRAARTNSGRYVLNEATNVVRNSFQIVIHQDTELTFYVPNNLNRFRVDSFSTKEPETLAWIDLIPENGVLWDIGANIGLYSCYAAKSRNCMVYAFEPSVFNLELLARNIFINNLVEKVVMLPLPLSDSLKISTLNMTCTDWGGALSSFGENFGDDGKALNKMFSHATVGLTLDQAVNLLNIPEPTHIKMDVDGLEHLILSGGERVLHRISELSIEVNEDFAEQRLNVADLCGKAGLVFREKKHSDMFSDDVKFGNTYNQIWYRPNIVNLSQK